MKPKIKDAFDLVDKLDATIKHEQKILKEIRMMLEDYAEELESL